MKNLPLIFAGAALILSLACCKKNTGCQFSENDGSYTATDINGNFLGTPDPQDWTNDGSWNTCEQNLFNTTDTFNYQNLTTDSVFQIAAFPNPFHNYLYLHSIVRFY